MTVWLLLFLALEFGLGVLSFLLLEVDKNYPTLGFVLIMKGSLFMANLVH